MALHNPPSYRYPLFGQWDRDTFEFIKRIAKKNKYFEIKGDSNNINLFLTTLIRSQKSLHDWREMLIDIVDQIKNTNCVDTVILNEKFPPQSIGKDIPKWVIYEEDEIINNFIDKLEHQEIKFSGTESQMAEFITRFILGQLGNDWKLTIGMIHEMLGDNDKLDIKSLNDELRTFDYLNLLA